MLKVVIADDEERVCRLVRMLADWEALGMEVVGTASNGLEALELVESLAPDILVTDIRMPGCDGMELIEKAKKASPHLEIALISGYAQFEYAQTAMHYDVGGYLLKPIKKDMLMSTLEKLGNNCRERAASTAILERLRLDSDKSSSLLRSRLLDDLLDKRISGPSREQLNSDYGFAYKNGVLQVFILKADCDMEQLRSPSMVVIKKKAEEIIASVVFSLCLAGVFQFHGSAAYGIINYEHEKNAEIRRALREALNQLEAQKLIFGNVEFSLAIGRAVDTPEELPASMHEARLTIAERIVEGCGRLLDAVLPPSELSSRKLLERYNKGISHAVDTLSAEEADSCIRELAGEVEAIPGVRGYEFLELVITAGKTFAMLLNIEDEALIIDEFEARCELCRNIPQLLGCLREFARRQIEAVRELRDNEAIRPIRIAKQYIHKHFSEPITLEDVCDATGFSVSYFSAMFKKETGEGFSKYLTRIRIDKAKSLLQDTNLSVEEICNQVGYNDLKHFTGTFKKATNLNPGQYRKLYG